jgi:hypothetical protein
MRMKPDQSYVLPDDICTQSRLDLRLGLVAAKLVPLALLASAGGDTAFALVSCLAGA